LSSNDYNAIIVSDNSDKNPINIKFNKILQCYKYFKEELTPMNFSIREGLFNRLSDNENKILVLIDLTEKDNEQAIFDTINNAGIRLSSADTVKNALFQKAIELLGSLDPVLPLHKEFWEDIFSNDEDSINFWDTERLTGRLRRDNIELLLHAIAVIKGFFDPDKNTLADIPSLYKDYINKLDEPKIITFIKEIAKYAKLEVLFFLMIMSLKDYFISSVNAKFLLFTPIFFHYTLNTTMLILFQNFVNLKNLLFVD
jgi:hypothetical protein